MIRSNIKFYLAIIILLIAATLPFYNSPKNVDIQDIIGNWEGAYKNSTILLVINSDKTCTLKIDNIQSKSQSLYNGICSLDNNKTPYSFSINNISETSYALYSLLLPVNKDGIKITEFSTKWKLRQISFNEVNTITLKKIIK